MAAPANVGEVAGGKLSRPGRLVIPSLEGVCSLAIGDGPQCGMVAYENNTETASDISKLDLVPLVRVFRGMLLAR